MANKEKQVRYLVNYFIQRNPFRARAILMQAGFPSNAVETNEQMSNAMMQWLQIEGSNALRTLMINHPDNQLFQLAREMDAKGVNSIPNSDPQSNSSTYFQNLDFTPKYPYTPQNLTTQAYPRTPHEQLVQGILTGRYQYTGNQKQEKSESRLAIFFALSLVALVLIKKL